MPVIVGSGIIGLYTAYILVKRNVGPITIVAQHMPGDYSTFYTSPWAGANFSFASGDDPRNWEFDRKSYTYFDTLSQELGPEAGIKKYPAYDLWHDFYPNPDKLAHLQQYVQDYRQVPKDQLPPNTVYGLKYTTYNLNTVRLLRSLKQYLEKRGVKFVQTKLGHIDQAFSYPHSDVVFNCTGIGARTLPGVEDQKVYPIRGQVVLVKTKHPVQSNYSLDHKDDTVTYIIPRAGPEGHTILGGYYQPNNWCGDTFKHMTESIIERTAQLCPEIKRGEIEIVRECTGLRPGREGGVRIELEPRPKGTLIHNYGAGGCGYQSGYGMALEAVDLVYSKAKL
uniref:ARAD1D37642p n=1 Tax=Blastobotrys adeninivorans TaxID=409370 RepID=A0A060TIC4_BLAAD